MPVWAIYALISNAAIIWTEYLNRSARDGWLEVLPQTAPLILLAQFCLFKAYNGAPQWLTAWMVFAIGNSVMRVLSIQMFAAGEISSWVRTLVGIGVMIAGAFLVKGGLK